MITVKKLFFAFQEEMSIRLKHNRHLLTHPVAKGDAAEHNWTSWLRSYLPKRYSVDNAFVIDHTGAKSQQIDIVIYDRQNLPAIFNQGDVKYIPAESVFAVFEVKQDLSKSHLEYAAEKIASVRRLKRTKNTFDYREHPTIIGGILTIDSKWTNPLGNTFKRHLKRINADPLSFINMGCTVAEGAFTAQQYNNSLRITTSSKEETLLFFFFALLLELNKIGTLPMLHVGKWTEQVLRIKN